MTKLLRSILAIGSLLGAVGLAGASEVVRLGNLKFAHFGAVSIAITARRTVDDIIARTVVRPADLHAWIGVPPGNSARILARTTCVSLLTYR